jgi:gliding motility-associated-like protein
LQPDKIYITNIYSMKTKLLNTLTATILFLFPAIVLGQAPNLGTAADFVLFSSVGAISNTGISHITGNVGTNSGSSTGFGNVNGVMNDNNGISAQCSADLLIAYNQLNATVPTFFIANLLGNGQILIPGVYSIPNATTLNLELILDAVGDPNAVFIIQIQGPLSTNANSKVKLINGAKACNVFWKIEGLVSMAAATVMRGTVIANNAAINMSTNDTLEGRALSTNGAITTDGVLAYTPIGCGSPLLTGPVAPTLTATECYTLFSSIGPVTNVGITNVIGDVGSDNGLTTGFNPLFVVGMIHPVPDGSTAACATDLTTVYNYLNAIPHDIELLYPAQFGNNLVLTPHTYLMNAAVTFTDTLFLNGQGNPNAVFLIKINGAISTSTYSKVILINGTQAKNVFWMVNGAVTINDYSIFNGTIICNNGAMNLNTGVTIYGRALTTTGALNTAAITAIMPPGCGQVSSPIITTTPANQTVCIGDSVSFTVIATGTNLTYQWRKGTVNLIDGGNISGATTATLTINPVTPLDAAIDYNVIVSGTYSPNDTSANIALIINGGPIITNEPSNQSVCIGDSAGFSVIASGNNLTYQWRKGTVNMVNGPNISGATSSTLSINPVALLDAATNYNVIVSGDCGINDTSINVSLAISTIPLITSEPSNQIICEGDSTGFSGIASGTNLTYQWRKGAVNLINGPNISGATTATLSINPATLLDAANNYNVIVSGGCLVNDTSINVSLTVNTVPIITTEPSNQIACIGDSTGFSVIATGNNLTYQWRKGTVNLINGPNISGATTSTLSINPATLLDAAINYNVIVSGGCLVNDTSINVSLTINTAPTITTEPTNQIACTGDSTGFSVIASGNNLTYQWRKGAVNLVNGPNISGATTSTLSINPATILDAATNYNVIVSGDCITNDTSINASLTINGSIGITSQPSNETVCEGSSASFSVTTIGTGISYQWRKGNVNLINGTSISGANTATLTINPTSLTDIANNYNVIITGTCALSDTSINVSLSVNPTPIASAGSNSTVCLDSTIYLTAQTVAGATYDWIGPNGYSSLTQNPIITTATSANSGSYTLIVSLNTCASTSTTSVVVDDCIITDFFIPEGFSPNGDGINDVFFIRGILDYPKNSIVIFNRWGDKVFVASPYQNTWDGKCKTGITIGNDDLPAGTYFYILDLNNNSDVYKGTIYLNK